MSAPAYINSVGLIPKMFEKITQAKVPERYTTDFQTTVLGYGSGSARAFIPFLKRLGFLTSDGKPTELYKRFRNQDSQGAAMAEAMRNGFVDIFDKNQYAYRLGDDKLKNLVVEVTGKEPSDSVVKGVVGSFKACNALADFEADTTHDEEVASSLTQSNEKLLSKSLVPYEERPKIKNSKINLGYTINLNLPETTDVEVFNAIFSALKTHLLEDE